MSLGLALWCVWLLGPVWVAAQPPVFASYLSLATLSYVRLPSATWFSGGAFTIEGWVRHGTYVKSDAVLFYASTNIASDTNIVALQVRQNGANDVVPRINSLSLGGATGALDAAGWIHVAIVRDPGNGVFVYVNGTLAASNGDATPTNTIRSFAFVGGTGSLGAAIYDYVGDIDELRIWQVARTGTQLANAMLTPLVGNEVGLLAYYRFDTCGATTATDSTSSGLTGNLTGSASIVCAPTPAPCTWAGISAPPPGSTFRSGRQTTTCSRP
jgi:hypothetical protein